MRPLRVSIAIASSVVLLAACGDGTRTDTAGGRARDSALARDLEIAGASDSSLSAADRRDSSAVTESPGSLDSTETPPDTAAATGATRPPSDLATVRPASTPSAEGYIGPSCASPAADDQQRCLLGYLARSDAQLDRSYQSLISRLKAEAGTRSNAPEPAVVQRLRTAQRQWLVYRDDECRKRTRPREGPLWAPIRAQCLAEYSALRARELDDALAKRKPLAAKAATTKSKRPSASKSSRARRRGGRR
jgi:uncharacterized protein YecT (DUF1311 family)